MKQRMMTLGAALMAVAMAFADGAKTMREAFADKFLIGTALSTRQVMSKNEELQALIKNQFSAVVAENCMKAESLQPEEGKFNFTDGDRLCDLAEKNGQVVTGHCLIWHSQAPRWFFKDENGNQVSREVLIQRMKDHIYKVVGHFKGRVKGWDVVNEAVNNEGTGFRGDDDIWYKNLGEEYIALAFQYAHEADPDALLFYNDYGMEWGPTKRGKICELISGLKEKGIPVHGIGLQMHTDINRSTADIRKAIEDAHACGVLVHVSEMDVNLYPEVKFDDNGNAVIPEGVVIDGNDQERLAKQKAVFKAAAEALSDLPAADVFGLTTWGVTDNSAYQLYYPLLFDKDYQKKPAYYGITETF